jgi:tRNA(fMet)-specific endonuclease VapC
MTVRLLKLQQTSGLVAVIHAALDTTMAFLIDTDIIIYSLKGDARVNLWLRANDTIPKEISVVTYGELIYGARKSQHPEKNLATVKRIGEIFPVVEINKGIMEVFAEIKSRLEKYGTRLDDMDTIIAATALYLNRTLVTDNVKHFSRIPDLVLEDWKHEPKP